MEQQVLRQRNHKGVHSHSTPYKCTLFSQCGGCQLLHTPYTIQLKKKQAYITQLLKQFGPISPIMGMEDPYFYRNKNHAVVHRTHNGKLVTGTYKEGSHQVIPVKNCYLQDQKANAIIAAIESLLPSFKIKAYNEDTGEGFLRHILIRTGHQSGEIMVVLVVSSFVFPSQQNFIKALRRLHPEITTIVLNINKKKTSMILDAKEKVIYGKGFIQDTLCGYTFRISSKAFYQVNPIQTEKLYHKAIEVAHLQGHERIIDAYCGIGTIGMIASRKVKEVIGVELNAKAVEDAQRNAQYNHVKNITFFNADAGKFMVDIARQNKEVIDVVFMDPPRTGSDKRFLDALVTLNPAKIVYISCGPESLARDLKYLVAKGYRVQEVCPVDMFPHTMHVECCVLLKKIK